MPYIASSNFNPGGAAGASAAVPVPTGAAAGDIVVVGLYLETTDTITLPSGFTVKSDLQAAGSAFSLGRLVTAWKRLTAADTGTYTFSWTGSVLREAVCGLWRGRITTGDPFSTAPSTNEAASNNLTVSGVNALLGDDLVGIATEVQNGFGWTPPSGFTERQDWGGAVTLDTKDNVAAGATGSVTFVNGQSGTSNMKGWLAGLLSGVYKKSATGNTSGTAAQPTVTTSETPFPTLVGDLVVVLHLNDFYALSAMPTPVATGSPTMNAITGATLDLGSSSGHIKGWWYVANTAGAQTITATETGLHDEEKGLIVYVFGGADTTSPIDAAATSNGTAINVISPSVSPTTSDAYLIVANFSAGGNTSVGPYTTPSPLTEDGEISVDLDGVFASTQLAASGATGTFTFTGSGSNQVYGGVTIAIKRASAGSPLPLGLVLEQNGFLELETGVRLLLE